MCVIYACATELPPYAELQAGATGNRDGAGIAWLEGDKVKWLKGLESDADKVLAKINELGIKPPLGIHFRIASVGGKDPCLTHPFPITSEVSLDLEGETDGSVLFHNGHVHNWDDYAFRAGLASDLPFPHGVWSDSRALAWLVYLKGSGVLRFTLGSGRILLLHPKSADDRTGWDNITIWGDWEDPTDEHQGWLASQPTRVSVIRAKDWDRNSGRGVYDCYGYDPSEPSEKEKAQQQAAETKSCSVDLKAATPFIWTVDELHELLAVMEGELRDARVAAGLEG